MRLDKTYKLKVVGVRREEGLAGDWIMTVVPDLSRKRKSQELAAIWEKSVTQGLLVIAVGHTFKIRGGHKVWK